MFDVILLVTKMTSNIEYLIPRMFTNSSIKVGVV